MDRNSERMSDQISCDPPLSPSGAPNGYSTPCAADGWIDKRWEHVTGILSKLSGLVSSSFHAEFKY